MSSTRFAAWNWIINYRGEFQAFYADCSRVLQPDMITTKTLFENVWSWAKKAKKEAKFHVYPFLAMLFLLRPIWVNQVTCGQADGEIVVCFNSVNSDFNIFIEILQRHYKDDSWKG